MWLPLRYKKVNYAPWFIMWKLKTHSFSNLIPPSMEQCSLWAKLANNVTNSDADVISIQGAAAHGDERVPDGSLPLLSPRLDNSPAVVIITWAIKAAEAVLFHFLYPSHLMLDIIVFLSFPVLGSQNCALPFQETVFPGHFPFKAALKRRLPITRLITAAFCNTKSHCNKSAVKNLIEWRVNVKVIMRRWGLKATLNPPTEWWHSSARGSEGEIEGDRQRRGPGSCMCGLGPSYRQLTCNFPSIYGCEAFEGWPVHGWSLPAR